MVLPTFPERKVGPTEGKSQHLSDGSKTLLLFNFIYLIFIKYVINLRPNLQISSQH